MDTPHIGGPATDSAGALSPEARCLGCGYSLHGLPGLACPECGRGFDPADPASYDTRPPGWRRRRWVRRGIALGTAAVLAAGLAPRGLMRGELRLTCATCGEAQTYKRVEPRPPEWIPFRYPGIGWWSPRRAAAAERCGCEPEYAVAIRSDLRLGGRVTGRFPWKDGGVVQVNGRGLDFDTAPLILNDLLAPENNGIEIGGP